MQMTVVESRLRHLELCCSLSISRATAHQTERNGLEQAETPISSPVSQGFAAAHVGAAATTLAWLSFALNAVVTIYFAVLMQHYERLDRIYD